MNFKYSLSFILLYFVFSLNAQLSAQKLKYYFVVGDSIEVKSTPNASAATVEKVGWGRRFKGAVVDENWIKLYEFDSIPRYIPARFMIKKRQFFKLAKNKPNKNAQTFYALIEHYKSRNRVVKARKYALQALMEAPYPIFYRHIPYTKKSEDGKRVVYYYGCNNIYGYATENLTPTGKVNEYFDNLEEEITDDLVRFYVRIRKMPAFRGMKAQSHQGFATTEKILLETPNIIIGGDDFVFCNPHQTQNLWDTFTVFTYTGADKSTRLGYKNRIKEIAQNSNNAKIKELTDRILSYYEKVDNGQFEVKRATEK